MNVLLVPLTYFFYNAFFIRVTDNDGERKVWDDRPISSGVLGFEASQGLLNHDIVSGLSALLGGLDQRLHPAN